MKKILFGLMGLMGLIGIVGCEKEGTDPEGIQGHDIFYTVSEETAIPNMGGTTAHLTTESEFDALLERFCTYTKEGAQVMFCSTRTNRKEGTTGRATSITTTDREELKAWMKDMERAGKTVHITYNNENGTWSGRAYTNLGQSDSQEPQMYTGSLDFVATPVLEEPPLGGLVWAMHTGADSTLIITVHGMMMWNEQETPDENMSMLIGAEMVLEGVVNTYTDLEGNSFMTLDINVEVEEQ